LVVNSGLRFRIYCRMLERQSTSVFPSRTTNIRSFGMPLETALFAMYVAAVAPMTRFPPDSGSTPATISNGAYPALKRSTARSMRASNMERSDLPPGTTITSESEGESWTNRKSVISFIEYFSIGNTIQCSKSKAVNCKSTYCWSDCMVVWYNAKP